jgi:hypothetical protein
LANQYRRRIQYQDANSLLCIIIGNIDSRLALLGSVISAMHRDLAEQRPSVLTVTAWAIGNGHSGPDTG